MGPSLYEKTVLRLEILCCLFYTENSLFTTKFYSTDQPHTVLKVDRIFKVMIEKSMLYMSVIFNVMVIFYSSFNFCVVLGLDKLIEHYRTSARGLPTKLTTHCKSRRPPPLSCAYGYSNILHRAILSGTISTVYERNISLKVGIVFLKDNL